MPLRLFPYLTFLDSDSNVQLWCSVATYTMVVVGLMPVIIVLRPMTTVTYCSSGYNSPSLRRGWLAALSCISRGDVEIVISSSLSPARTTWGEAKPPRASQRATRARISYIIMQSCTSLHTTSSIMLSINKDFSQESEQKNPLLVLLHCNPV
jgi:hypothetical protein